MEALQSPFIEGASLWVFVKPLYRRDFIMEVYAHTHNFLFFPTNTGGALLWMLHKTPL